ncbi:MAG: gliding motility-associated C-terminal domain-containing protein [Candidatus Pedobacter colombiensis]|uniref:Gliding motility-associated C-terminal domain-containing protein n=1 Tax=Candidatus Pedobacter colombiensis TaxID=3121371 RepID=A0AAJ6B4Q7_9SPHI|nr:gliding motility-associated C-terminal domain-containing protein [Pedobacter sp.]WEK17927.1 MAG: gliding motility-associated C-terminal domain-containing protein [Pedobacter sp.]
MKWLSILFAITFLPLLSQAQGENNIWTFASYPTGNNTVLNFNAGSPFFSTIPSAFDLMGYGATVCSPNGTLRFYVRLSNYNSLAPAVMNIYLPSGIPVTGSNLTCSVDNEWCMPVVIPHPTNPDQYYIFYGYNKGLLYSLLDMSLNNGNGGIVNGHKDVVISPYGTVVSQKMTAIKACSGVWLVIRSRIANEYYSFIVDRNGLHPEKVISTIGNFSLQDYNQIAFGYLKASPTGNNIAISNWKGIELYDFEKCSGKLKNAKVLEMTGNSEINSYTLANHERYNGICFSPDGTKLYASQNYRSQSITTGLSAGKLFQYDLSLVSTPAIIASKTLIITNPPSMMENGLTCSLVAPNPLGEIKQGSDGKLYVDNGSYTCLNPSNIPVGFNPGPAFHVISLPNISGLACQPQLNNNILNDYLGNMGGSFFGSALGGTSFLPQDIVVSTNTVDTIQGNVYNYTVCFSDSLVLVADTNGSCHQWDNSLSDIKRTVFHTGTYHVSYFKDCNYATDTFYVKMVHTPTVETHESCPGMHMGIAIASIETNTSTLNYIWRAEDGSILKSFTGNDGDTLRGLDPGNYLLQITTSTGCDTTIHFEILPLPKPEVIASPADTMIRYGDSILLHAEGALLYTWWPTSSLDTASKADPISRPLKPVLLYVVGINEYGCMDTTEVNINIDFTMPDFAPNAFSPNGDGINDVFNISNITYQKVVQFKVFNRYGQMIFSTLDGHKGWNGTQNGRDCDMGSYYYLIELDYPNGLRKLYKGDINLIR